MLWQCTFSVGYAGQSSDRYVFYFPLSQFTYKVQRNANLDISFSAPLSCKFSVTTTMSIMIMTLLISLRWNTWAAALWLIAGMSALSTVFLFFFLPETLPANILLRRAKQLREATGDSRYHSPSEMTNKKGNVFIEMIENIAVDFKLSFIDPVILFINVHTMLIYGILYLWFEFFPYGKLVDWGTKWY